MRQRVVLAVVQRTKGKAQMPANSSATGRRAIVLPPLEEGGEGSERLDENIARTGRDKDPFTGKSRSKKRSKDPGHLISHTFPPRFAPFVPALFSSCLAFFFAAKKKTRRAETKWNCSSYYLRLPV